MLLPDRGHTLWLETWRVFGTVTPPSGFLPLCPKFMVIFTRCKWAPALALSSTAFNSSRKFSLSKDRSLAGGRTLYAIIGFLETIEIIVSTLAHAYINIMYLPASDLCSVKLFFFAKVDIYNSTVSHIQNNLKKILPLGFTKLVFFFTRKHCR